MASFSIESYFAYVAETFTADVIQSYQGQGLLQDAPLIQGRDPLEDFRNFDNVDNDNVHSTATGSNDSLFVLQP